MVFLKKLNKKLFLTDLANKKADTVSKSNSRQKNNENINSKILTSSIEQIPDKTNAKNKYNAESSSENHKKTIENTNLSEMCKNINHNDNFNIEHEDSKNSNVNPQPINDPCINVPANDKTIKENPIMNNKRVENKQDKLCTNEPDKESSLKNKLSDKNETCLENINVYDSNLSLKNSSSENFNLINDSNKNTVNELKPIINFYNKNDGAHNIIGARPDIETIKKTEYINQQADLKIEGNTKIDINEIISHPDNNNNTQHNSATIDKTEDNETKTTDTINNTNNDTKTGSKDDNAEEGNMLARRKRRGREKPHFFDPLEYCVSFRKVGDNCLESIFINFIISVRCIYIYYIN